MKHSERAEVDPRRAGWRAAAEESKRGAGAPSRDALRRQVKALAAQVELLQGCVADMLKTRPEDGRGPSEYDWFVKRFQQWAAERLPARARALVVSRGDRALLDIRDRRTGHFPQDDTAQYAGFYPADCTAAIGHLEALRHDGYDTLVFPKPALWWLEHYDGLREHLETYYVESATDAMGRIYDLRPEAGKAASRDLRLDQVIAQARRGLGRDPDLLDWTTGANLSRRLPALAVADFSGHVLPHCDRSIDIVAVPDDAPAAVREGRRVAAVAVVVMSDERAVRVEWIDRPRPQTPVPVTVMLVPDPLGPGRTVTRRLMVEDAASEDAVVWMSAGVVAFPGAMAALLRTLRRFPGAGVVGGRILDFTGRLHHAGGAMAIDGSLSGRGEGALNPDDPRFAHVQTVDYCSSLFMAATRRAFDAAGGFDSAMPCGPLRDADFCLRVQDRGFSIHYQPDSVAVCSAELSRALRAPAEPALLRQARCEFAVRWKSVLQSRVPRGDVWGI